MIADTGYTGNRCYGTATYPTSCYDPFPSMALTKDRTMLEIMADFWMWIILPSPVPRQGGSPCRSNGRCDKEAPDT